MLLKYDAVIRDQIDQGIVEKASSIVTGKEFYLPHCAVVRDDAETTKTQIVYDAFAHEREHTPSLNNCLQTGTPLQNQLWSVIVRNQFHLIVVAGDIEKAFLQVRIREPLGLHWSKDIYSTEIKILHLSRIWPNIVAFFIEQSHHETSRTD